MLLAYAFQIASNVFILFKIFVLMNVNLCFSLCVCVCVCAFSILLKRLFLVLRIFIEYFLLAPVIFLKFYIYHLDPNTSGIYILSHVMCMLSCFSRVRLLLTLWTADRQAPLSMGFSRQELEWVAMPSSRGSS